MISKTENYDNILVNINETGSFIEFDEKDLNTNFFNDITTSNFETSYFKPNEVKSYLRSTLFGKT